MAHDFKVGQGGSGSGYDYGDLESAVDAIVDDAENIIRIQGAWTVNGGTTGSMTITNPGNSSKLTIIAEGAARTNGIEEGHTNGNSDAYRHIEAPTANDSLFYVLDEIEFDGFEIGLDSATGTSHEIIRADGSGNTYTFKNMLMYALQIYTEQDCIYTNNNILTVSCENVVSYNFRRAFLDQYTNDDCTLSTNCCTFYNIGDSDSSTSRSGIFGMHGTGTHVWNSLNCLIHTGGGHAYTTEEGTDTANWEYNTWHESALQGSTNPYCFDDTVDTINDEISSTSTTTLNADFVEGAPTSGDIGFIDTTDTGGYNFNLYDDTAGNDLNVAIDFCPVAPTETGANSGLTMLSVDIAGNTRYAGTSGYYDCGAFSVQSAPAGGGVVAGSLSLMGVGI